MRGKPLRLCRTAVIVGVLLAAFGMPAEVPRALAAVHGSETEGTLLLSLEDCLRLATRNNPEYLSRKESVDQAALNLTKSRHSFSISPAAEASSRFTGGPGADNEVGSEASLSAGRNLEQGGRITAEVTSSNDHSFQPENEDTFSSSLSLNFSQPLLRGAGILVAREPLTQAERNLVYAERNFELYRQNFVIDIASRYWRLLQRRRAVESRKKALDSAVFSRDMTKERFELLGKGQKLDELTSEVNLLKAQDDLNKTEQDYRFSVDSFKLDLGIDIQTPVELVEEEVAYQPLEVELQQCIETALARRLDLLSAKDKFEDARRALAIVKDTLRPSLNFDASYTVPGTSASSFADQRADDPYYSAGLTLKIPIDRRLERANLSLEVISFVQRERSLNRLEDEIVLQVRGAVRDLERADYSLKIQQLNEERSGKLLELAELKMGQGEITSRDFEDARNDYIDAQDSYNAALVDLLIAKLQLRRVIGTLYVDTDISW